MTGPSSLPATVSAANAPPPPPHPLDGEWFVYLDGKNYGPYTGHALAGFAAEGRIDEKTSVCAVGDQQWTAASKVAALMPLFARKPGAVALASGPAGASPAPPAEIRNDSGTVVQITQHFGAGPGYSPELYAELGPKSPGLALLLSFFIPGVGQMYNGQVGKGIGMLVLCVALWFALLGWVIWIWAMVDAYTSAKTINIAFHRRSGQPWPSQ